MNVRHASVRASGGNGLWQPWIFQSGDMLGSTQPEEQIVDIRSIDPNHASLVVSAYLPDARAGDTVQVFFGGVASQTYPKQGASLRPKLYVHDIGFFPLNQIAAPGVYDVYYKLYRTGDSPRTSPSIKVNLIDSNVPGWRPHECGCYGYYPAGLVDAWVISGGYRLSDGDALVRTIASGTLPGANAKLQITVQTVPTQPAKTIGTLAWQAGQWKLSLNGGEAQFARGDLVTLCMDNAAFLNFALAL
jgi:hypothetical protein